MDIDSHVRNSGRCKKDHSLGYIGYFQEHESAARKRQHSGLTANVLM